MSLKYINVDKDVDIANAHADVWKDLGIRLQRFDDMTETIQELLTNTEYLCITINSDTVDFMPLLSTMRSLTNIPILIATDSFTTQKEVAALENGADLYTPWHEKPEDNMASVMAHVTQLSERSKMPRPSTKVMVYKGLLIAPIYRTVFVDNKRIDLTRQEYDLLYYLMMNHGKVLSYNEIFNSVWGSDYDGSERKVLRNAVKRLREKLKVDSKNIGHIKTVLDYGYTFPFESDK